MRRNGAKPAFVTGPMDRLLAAVVIALSGFGVLMVFSASASEATVTFQDPYHFLERQALFAGGAVAVMLLLSRIDYTWLRRGTYVWLAAAFLLLGLSLSHFGHAGGGAVRWLRFGGWGIQPAEVAKLALIVWLSYSLEKKREQLKTFSVGLLPHGIVAGLLMTLCLFQPDFGSAVVLIVLTLALLFVAGARLIDVGGTCVVAGVAVFLLIYAQDYRSGRVHAWEDILANRHTSAYQPYQSLMSFGSGELFGVGLGKGLQVLYLPEAHNDFIAAIVGEELGFVGVVGLCIAYLLFVTRGLRAGMAARDAFGSYLAFGISLLVGLQALVNLAVAMALLPTKGLTLPFVSYGGSSLFVNAAAAGILLNISREREAERSGPVSGPAEASGLVLAEADAPGARASRRREVPA